jgi:D-alanine transaminase/branched-chain amino acid aminotransferase
MSTKYISINNQLYTEDDAKISVSDLSVQRGFGIFDFLKTVNGKAIFIEDHLNRFYNSAKEMNLEVDYSRNELLKAIGKLTEQNNIPNSGIKIILTGGFSPDGYTLSKPNLIITQVPFEINNKHYSEGFKLVTYNHQRQLPSIKTIDYLQAIRLQPYIKENHADDVLYHNNETVCECPRANFFIVTHNEVITPKSNILKGITRSKILNLKPNGYPVIERDFTLNDIAKAKEAFISSSTKNAFPVIAIDGKPIGNGKAGEITTEINKQLNELIRLA